MYLWLFAASQNKSGQTVVKGTAPGIRVKTITLELDQSPWFLKPVFSNLSLRQATLSFHLYITNAVKARNKRMRYIISCQARSRGVEETCSSDILQWGEEGKLFKCHNNSCFPWRGRQSCSRPRNIRWQSIPVIQEPMISLFMQQLILWPIK